MRTYPSPFMTCLIVIGIVTMAVLPPLGIIFLIAAAMVQKHHVGGLRAEHKVRYDRAVAVRDARTTAAYRYFS